jgi:O-antigen ligase
VIPPGARLMGTTHSSSETRARHWSWRFLIIATLCELAHLQDQYRWAPVLALMVVAFTSRPRRMYWSVSGMPYFIGFSVVLTVVTLLNRSWDSLGFLSFVAVRGQIFYATVCFLVFLLNGARLQFDRSLLPGVIIGIATLALGVTVSMLVHPLAVLGEPLSANGQVLGLYGGHNPTAGVLGLGVLVATIWLGEVRAPRALVWFFLVALVVMIIAFVFAASRGYGIGLVVALLAYAYVRIGSGWRRRSVKASTIAAIAVLLAISAPFIPAAARETATDPNVMTRFALWRRSFTFIAQSPLIGLGPGAFSQVNFTSDSVIPGVLAIRLTGVFPASITPHDVEGGLHTHNSYLEILVDVGIVGLGLLALLGRVVFRQARDLESSHFQDIRALGIAVQLTLVYLGVAGLTAGFVFSSVPTGWFLWAASARVLRWRQLASSPGGVGGAGRDGFR